MHNSCRILLSCLVLGASVSACSGASAPENSAAGGTAETFAGGSNGLGSGGTGGGSIVAEGGGNAVTGGSTAGGGPAGTGGSQIGINTGGANAFSTGGANAISSGGSNATGGRINTGGTNAINTGGSSTLSTGGANTTGGRSSTGGTSAIGTGGANTTGGRSSTGGANPTGGRVSTGGTNTVSTGGASTGGTSGGNTGTKPDPNSLPSITVHLAGDSTMANYAATTTQEGWGQEFGQFFISKVTIDNQAQGGANVQTFYTGRWKTLIANVQAGDYVFAAFGINDSGTTHGPVTPADFQAEFSQMADEVAAKKATFIPTTSSPLQAWVGGKETNTRLQPYCDATIAVGKAKGLPVDDLNARAIEYYNSIGATAAAALTFNGDKAHFNKAGATAMARLASQELTRIGSPLAAYLK